MARACVTAVACVLCWRAVVFARVRLWEHMPLPFFGPPDAPSAPVLDTMAAHGYYGHVPRMCPLAMGVLTALVASDAGARRTLARSAPPPQVSRSSSSPQVQGVRVHQQRGA